MRSILRCYDCGKKIGYEEQVNCGSSKVPIYCVTDKIITDKTATKQLRYVDSRKQVNLWVCGNCAKETDTWERQKLIKSIH